MGTRLRGSIGLALLVGLLAVPAADGAEAPRLMVGSDAVRVTRTGDVLVAVPVRVTCEAPADARVEVAVVISQGINPTTVAHAFGRQAVACSGATRGHVVGVVAQNVPFRAGGAAVRAMLTICAPPPPPPGPPRPSCTSEEVGPRLLELVPTGTSVFSPTP